MSMDRIGFDIIGDYEGRINCCILSEDDTIENEKTVSKSGHKVEFPKVHGVRAREIKIIIIMMVI